MRETKRTSRNNGIARKREIIKSDIKYKKSQKKKERKIKND